MSVCQQCEPRLHASGGAQDGKGHLTLTTEHQQKPEAPQVAPLEDMEEQCVSELLTLSEP